MPQFETLMEAQAEIDTLYEYMLAASDELMNTTVPDERARVQAEIDYANSCIHAAEMWIESRN